MGLSYVLNTFHFRTSRTSISVSQVKIRRRFSEFALRAESRASKAFEAPFRSQTRIATLGKAREEANISSNDPLR
jgi:hypothetical protein